MSLFRITNPTSWMYLYPLANSNLQPFPPGMIMSFAGAAATDGFLVCDGSAVSRTVYPKLFAAISTTFGSGDGSTTFNLPDLRGRFVMGESPSHSLASTGGAEQQTISVSQLPAHNHPVSDPGHSHTVSDPGHSHTSNAVGGSIGLCIADGSNTATETDSSGGELNVWTTPQALTINSQTTGVSVNTNTTGVTVGNTGGGSPLNILNPYIVLSYQIKF